MKVIIDIPNYEFDNDVKDKFQDYFKRVKVDIADGTLCGNYELETTDMFSASFKHATYIPKGATNGDIFTSIFKPYKVKEHTLCVSIYKTEHDFKQGIEWLVFVSNWWNAPYESEG